MLATFYHHSLALFTTFTCVAQGCLLAIPGASPRFVPTGWCPAQHPQRTEKALRQWIFQRLFQWSLHRVPGTCQSLNRLRHFGTRFGAKTGDGSRQKKKPGGGWSHSTQSEIRPLSTSPQKGPSSRHFLLIALLSPAFASPIVFHPVCPASRRLLRYSALARYCSGQSLVPISPTSSSIHIHLLSSCFSWALPPLSAC